MVRMRCPRRVRDDLSSGANLEIYVTALLSLPLAALGALDVAGGKVLAAATLATLARTLRNAIDVSVEPSQERTPCSPRASTATGTGTSTSRPSSTVSGVRPPGRHLGRVPRMSVRREGRGRDAGVIGIHNF
ncbi:hypothetical protein ACFWD7_44305 [Streptomyces mirabilis]|uniref:hypothetical protein n=1 Tax=Streptomyces mirabilis TaxID=68239 RepID=UPI00369D3E43